MKQDSYWFAVAGVSLLTPVVVNLAADRLGHVVPGLKELNDYTTRRNG